ncbi:MAG: hypothetical protein HFF09_02445 [Oscillospiraceae bacterium]|nr:hypothetical protein [Oscillospiraceae bacterium]
MKELEHPDVTWALETGYPTGNEEIKDTREDRKAFAEVYAREFFDYLAENEPSMIDGFVEENWWMYEEWLR